MVLERADFTARARAATELSVTSSRPGKALLPAAQIIPSIIDKAKKEDAAGFDRKKAMSARWERLASKWILLFFFSFTVFSSRSGLVSLCGQEGLEI